jgi:aromatic ring-cleaving dioxygenase
MTTDVADPALVQSYHAHVYYRPETRAHAAAVRDQLGARFPVQLGRWHDALVGPHSRSMYQVAFPAEAFGTIVPWLMLNRGPLDVLVHAETGNDLRDHTAHTLWLGEPLPLRLEALAGPESGEGAPR